MYGEARKAPVEIDINERILPIVNKIVQRYRNKIPNEYEDFKSECYLSALAGVKKWKETDKKASLSSWVWICVSGRIKDFNKKKTVFTVSFNDDLQLPAPATTKTNNSITTEVETRLSKIPSDKTTTYRQLIDVVFPAHAKTLKKAISRQRVYRIKSKAQEILAGLEK